MNPLTGPERAAVQSVAFKTRIVKLAGKVQLEAVFAILRNLPLGADLEVVIRKAVKQRGLPQNAYYWLRLGEIADQAWVDGRQFSKEVWHEHARQEVMPEMVTLKTGEVVSKWVEMPSGKPVVISTTQLERKCFADYTTAVEAMGSDLGVQFSANPQEYEQ